MDADPQCLPYCEGVWPSSRSCLQSGVQLSWCSNNQKNYKGMGNGLEAVLIWGVRYTHSVVLCKGGDWQGHGQGAEEAVDAVGKQGSLDAAPVGGACGLDAGDLGSGSHISDDLHAKHYEAHQVW